jgi:hypothetical protein
MDYVFWHGSHFITSLSIRHRYFGGVDSSSKIAPAVAEQVR